MITFNGDTGVKQRVLDVAASFAGRIGKKDKQNDRNKLFWSRRQWCPGQYVCQKGDQCDHRFYADEIGVPVAVAYAERAVFLELSDKDARGWWKRFLTAIPVGVDLDEAQVWKKLALFVLAHPQHGLITFAHDREQYDAIRDVIELFRSDSKDAAAWDAAAAAAMAAYHKAPGSNTRMEAPEALKHAGGMACYATYYFARSFADQRFASEAISWSGWCSRYKTYAHFMGAQRDPHDDVKVDDRGMVNAGAALWASGQWLRLSDEGDRLGEVQRSLHNTRVANELVGLMVAATPRHPVVRVLRSMVGMR
jgi:hypothetical protein